MQSKRERQWLWGLLTLLAGMVLSTTQRLPALAVLLELVGAVWCQIGLSRLGNRWWGLLPAGLWGGWNLVRLLPLVLRPAFSLALQWPLLAWYGVLIIVPGGLLLLIHGSVRGQRQPQDDQAPVESGERR